MAKTLSKMLALGTIAPDFILLEPKTGHCISLPPAQSAPATVILFICNHCPFVLHIKAGIIKLAHDYLSKGVKFIAINANDAVTYPADAPEKMAAEGYPFPYLFDATQTVAKAYQAACTPDCYIFDTDLRCVYRGQFDAARPQSATPVTGQDLREALEAILSGHSPQETQHPSVGCSIKWQ